MQEIKYLQGVDKPRKMTEELWEKRIGWAHNALEWCHHHKSDWGIKYWSGVVSKLRDMKPESMSNITYH